MHHVDAQLRMHARRTTEIMVLAAMTGEAPLQIPSLDLHGGESFLQAAAGFAQRAKGMAVRGVSHLAFPSAKLPALPFGIRPGVT